MSNTKDIVLPDTETTLTQQQSTQSTHKQGRKKKVIPEEIVVEKPEVETISYSKAEKMTRKKRGMSEKQKENMMKLIALNKERREKQKEEEAKARALEEAKAKQKVLKVLPKRQHKKKEKPESKCIQREETESESDDDKVPPSKGAVSESEGTKEIKKKVKKLQSLTSALDNLPTQFKKPDNPYLGILKKSGF